MNEPDSLEDLGIYEPLDVNYSNLIIDEDSEEEAISGDLVIQELALEGELTQDEAAEITHAIKSTVSAVFILLARAHEGKAYKALGYKTWKDYIDQEFDFSVQRSYQLLNLAEATSMIEKSTPEGTNYHLTEAQARDIKRELPKITEKIKEATSGATPEEARNLVHDIVETEREEKSKKHERDDNHLPKGMEVSKEEYEEEESRKLEEQASRILEADKESSKFFEESEEIETLDDLLPEGYSDVKSGLEIEDEGPSTTKTKPIFDFFTAISLLDDMPEPDIILSSISPSKYRELSERVASTRKWLDELSELLG